MKTQEPITVQHSWLWRRKTALLLAGLVVGAIGLGLSAALMPPWYDDACHWLVARTLAHTGETAFPLVSDMTHTDPDSRFVTVGPAVNYPVAGWMAVFGDDFRTVRILMSGLAVGVLVALFMLARAVLHSAKAVWAVILLSGSVPFMTFGSQLLGEGPMLLYLLLGLWALLRNSEIRWCDALLAALAFNLAILSKEYIALPLGLTVLFGFVHALVKHEESWSKYLAIGLLLPIGVALHYNLRFDSWMTLNTYWAAKSAYSSEFLALTFTQSLRFLLLKPVVVLGTLALAFRVVFTTDRRDVILLVLQLQLLLWFLLSAGYERFGLLLLPIACVYLGEWVYAVLLRMDTSLLNHRRLQQVVFLLVVLLVSWQKWWVNPVLQQRTTHELLTHQQTEYVFTYELEAVPQLYRRTTLTLPQYTPAEAEQGQCVQRQFDRKHPILPGPYAHEAYRSCWQASKGGVVEMSQNP